MCRNLIRTWINLILTSWIYSPYGFVFKSVLTHHHLCTSVFVGIEQGKIASCLTSTQHNRLSGRSALVYRDFAIGCIKVGVEKPHWWAKIAFAMGRVVPNISELCPVLNKVIQHCLSHIQRQGLELSIWKSALSTGSYMLDDIYTKSNNFWTIFAGKIKETSAFL